MLNLFKGIFYNYVDFFYSIGYFGEYITFLNIILNNLDLTILLNFLKATLLVKKNMECHPDTHNLHFFQCFMLI